MKTQEQIERDIEAFADEYAINELLGCRPDHPRQATLVALQRAAMESLSEFEWCEDRLLARVIDEVMSGDVFSVEDCADEFGC